MQRIVLLENMDAVLAWRKSAATRGDSSMFGDEVSAPRAWLSGLWDVYGDGRSLASVAQRNLAMFDVMASEGSGLSASPGSVKLMLRLASEGLGCAAFDAFLENPAAGDFRYAESMRMCMVRYEERLAAASLVEAGRAWQLLSGQQVLCEGDVVEVRCPTASAAMLEFFASQRGVDVCDLSTYAASIQAAPANVDARFAFPTGRYAEPALLVDFIKSLPNQATIAVAAKEPFAMYNQLAPRLAAEGIDTACQARVPFSATDFGRAVMAAACFVKADPESRVDWPTLSDYLLNPFSGYTPQEANDFEAEVRGDRLFTTEQALSKLRSEKGRFEYLEQLLESPEAASLLGPFEDLVWSVAAGREAYANEQLGAIGQMRDVWESACMLGASIEAAIACISQAAIDVSRATGDAARVHVLAMQKLASAKPASFSWVLLCDMTNSSYPLSERHDAASELLDALGVPRRDLALPRSRNAFSACLAAAERGFVVERCQNDADGNPTYPAAVVEEFIDCYRDDPTNLKEIDNDYALPACLQAGLVCRGEQALHENESLYGAPAVPSGDVEAPSMAEVSASNMARLVLPGWDGSMRAQLDGPCFSPSQIECYMDCPQKWFASRRMHLDELDEEFDALHMGSYAHGILERFYKRFQETVAPKVTDDSLGVAQALLDEVIDEAAEEQFAKPSFAKNSFDTRLVPASELEYRQMEELHEKLRAFIKREPQLLPGFEPKHFEYGFDGSKRFKYAGHYLSGRVDRIDVDAQGRAVIVDYKGSLGSDFCFYDSEKNGGALREGKVQALIYAQAIKRLLGLNVVGAIYVSYGNDKTVQGVVDESIAVELPSLKRKQCIYKGDFGPAFQDLLDETERRLARVLDELLIGDIARRPANNKVCSFCPETSCPERMC